MHPLAPRDSERHIRRHDSLSDAKDIWRHSPLRFAGYTNELGEAFRPLINVRWVYLSYACSMAYVIGDTVDKSSAERRRALKNGLDERHVQIDVTATALDVLGWQTIASVLVPGLVINRIVAAAGSALKSAGRQPKMVPTLVGLAAIPLVVHPIDAATDALFDHVLRPIGRDKLAEIKKSV